MLDLKAFRKANNLTQAELSDVMGISRSFLGQIECGISKMPDGHLRKLLANTDYDTSMLVVDDSAAAMTNTSIGYTAEIALLKAEIESLRDRLAEARAEKEKYWEMIQKLMK